VYINIIQTNCDGYTSKKESFVNSIKERAPDILVIQETALKEKQKIKIKDYFSFCKNREKEKGGVGTVVANHLKDVTTKVAEGKDGDEYIITRLEHVVPAINIVNVYGHQESREGKDQILASWIRLRKDLQEMVQMNGEFQEIRIRYPMVVNLSGTYSRRRNMFCSIAWT
jgi:exonuclease III